MTMEEKLCYEMRKLAKQRKHSQATTIALLMAERKRSNFEAARIICNQITDKANRPSLRKLCINYQAKSNELKT